MTETPAMHPDANRVTLVPDPMIGLDVGDGYVIKEKLAEGGMGALYVAQHTAAPNKKKAIKVILAEMMAKYSPATRESLWHRFEVEARITLNLDHPNVVNVDGWGRLPTGEAYIKMELLSGKDLRQWAKDRHGGTVPPDDMLRVLAQVCGALEQAHRLGVVHRDLKPENIFMTQTEDGTIRTKLLDFGIARVVNPQALPGGKKTTIPQVIGTPGYWSPEQQTAPGEVDHRADIYALGVITYELTTGTLPGGSIAPHLLPPTFPLNWYGAIAQALAGDPAQRQQSVRAFLEALINATPHGTAIAAHACPSSYRNPIDAGGSTMRAPLSVMAQALSASSLAALPASTLARAAGAYGTQASPRRGRALVLAALGGAAVAAAIAAAVVTGQGSAAGPSTPLAPSSVSAPTDSAMSSTAATATASSSSSNATTPTVPSRVAAPADAATSSSATRSVTTAPRNATNPTTTVPSSATAAAPSSSTAGTASGSATGSTDAAIAPGSSTTTTPTASAPPRRTSKPQQRKADGLDRL